jgi:hypothetical protein
MFNRSHKLEASRIAVAALLLIVATDVLAVPSFTRQTGRSCSACHTVFPELTQYGREFKLSGYTDGDKLERKEFPLNVPVSVAGTVSRLSTRTTSDDAPESFETDGKTKLQVLSLYYAGKIAGNFGALAQYNYDGIEHQSAIEMADIRYANESTLGKDKQLLYGVTLNNNPTLSDIYNSTPMWGFPHLGPDRGVMPNAATVVDNTLFAKAGGIGAYGLWNDLVYGEVALYRRADKGLMRPFSSGVDVDTVVDGYAPYWRLALQFNSKPHSFEFGTYGLTAKIFPDATMASGPTDRFTDVALDGQYQFIRADHIVTAHATWIRETQELSASFPLGLTENSSSHLRTQRADVHYYYKRTVGGGVQYFSTSGDTDLLRFDTGEAVTGSAAGSPNTRGWMVEANYLPIQYVKIGARYTWYNKFNGGDTNYDGLGRNAADNNTLFLYVWALF